MTDDILGTANRAIEFGAEFARKGQAMAAVLGTAEILGVSHLIDAPDRSVCALTGEIADGLSFPALVPAAAEVERLTAALHVAKLQIAKANSDRDDARAELDNHMGSMKDLGSLVAVLTSQAAMWQVDRDEQRERGDEYADMHKASLATIDELEAEIRELTQRLADAGTARDTANARGEQGVSR